MRSSWGLRAVLVGLVALPAGAVEIWTDIGSRIAKFDSDNPAVISYVGGNTGELPLDGMDFTTDGLLYGVADQELFLINQANGTLQSLGVAQTVDDEIFFDISWDPSTQTMYAIGGACPIHLYQLNLSNGAATLLGSLSTSMFAWAGGLATSAAGVRYVDDDMQNGLYRLNGLNGTFLGPEGFDFTFFGGMTIDWSRDGTLYHATFDQSTFLTELWTVDLDTGLGDPRGTIGDGNVLLLSAAIKPVPEPGSALALALLAFCAARRRGG